jgi:hypothetical protein
MLAVDSLMTNVVIQTVKHPYGLVTDRESQYYHGITYESVDIVDHNNDECFNVSNLLSFFKLISSVFFPYLRLH